MSLLTKAISFEVKKRRETRDSSNKSREFLAISTFHCTERCSSVFLFHNGNKQNARMSDDKRSALEFAR